MYLDISYHYIKVQEEKWDGERWDGAEGQNPSPGQLRPTHCAGQALKEHEASIRDVGYKRKCDKTQLLGVRLTLWTRLFPFCLLFITQTSSSVSNLHQLEKQGWRTHSFKWPPQYWMKDFTTVLLVEHPVWTDTNNVIVAGLQDHYA